MIFKTIITVIVAFIVLVIAVPLLLSAVGIDLLPGGGSGRPGASLLFRSEDHGAHWEESKFIRDRRGPFPTYIFDVATHPTATTTVFVGTKSAGLWKSEDAGITWRQMRDAAGVLDPRSDVYRVVVSRARPEVMYLAVYQESRGRVLRSEDGGASFRQIYFVGRERFAVFDLATPPARPDTIMVATGEGRLLASDDGGKRWHFVKVLRDPIARLAMHPRYPNEGYLLTSRGQTLRTYDGGVSWTDLGLPVRGAVIREGNLRVIEHPYSRLAFFPSRAIRGSVRDTLALDPHHTGVVYRTRGGNLLQSINGGAGWTPLSTFIDGLGVSVGGIAVHPSEADTLMVTAGQALYTSRDRGINWSIVPFAGRETPGRIYIHSDDPAVLFITSGR